MYHFLLHLRFEIHTVYARFRRSTWSDDHQLHLGLLVRTGGMAEYLLHIRSAWRRMDRLVDVSYCRHSAKA